MKKLIMVIAVTAMAALGALADHVHCVCGTGACAVGGHTHSDVEWTAWTATDSLPTAAGYWYLASDVTLTKAWEPVDGTYLCLNGCVIRQTAGETTAMAHVAELIEASLVLTDCNVTRTRYFSRPLTAENAVDAHRYSVMSDTPSEGALAVAGGAVTGGNSSNGGAFCLRDATLTIYGGTIVGNGCAAVNAVGGAIDMEGSAFRMYGGRICGNSSTRSGAIQDAAGEIRIYRGLLDHNFAAERAAGVLTYNGTVSLYGGTFTAHDGGTAVDVEDGNLDLFDCTITNNAGGGVCYSDGWERRFCVGGKVLVTDNGTFGALGNPTNVVLNWGSVLTYDAERPLADGARLGITLMGEPVGPITQQDETDRSARFTSDNGDCVVYYGENEYDAFGEENPTYKRVSLGARMPVTFDANGGTNAPAALTNTYCGGRFTFPEPGEMGRDGYTFAGWTVPDCPPLNPDAVYAPGAVTPFISQSAVTVYADWKLAIIQQPHATNDYTVLVSKTDGVAYQWRQRTERPFGTLTDGDDFWVYDYYDSGSDVLVPDEWNGYVYVEMYCASEGDELRFVSTEGDLAERNENVVLLGIVSEGLYAYLVRCDTDCPSLEIYCTSPLQSPTLVQYKTMPGQTTNCLTGGMNGKMYDCQIKYESGAKSVVSDPAVWEGPDTLVEVRPVEGANATVEGVYTNEVAVVPVGGKYYVFYGEEVGVDFAANDGYLFPTTLDRENPVFTATEDPTVIQGASAYPPHTCHDMKLVVPIGDLETFYLVCSNSYSGYLTANLTVDHDIALGLVQSTAPQICLNGHVLDLNGHAFLQTGISAYFCDCQHGVARHYEADEGGLWHIVETPSATSHRLDGGVIIGGSAGENPGVFDNGVVSLTFLDVNVVGNDGGEGAVVYSSCKTRFIGGALCGNRADLGILYEAQEYDCWCRVGGGVRISDNVSTNGTPCNLLVREGETINFDPDVPLETNATIGVTAEYGPITENLPKDYSPCFTPDRDGDIITNRANNQLFLLGPLATVTFDANGGTGAPAAITTLRAGEVLTLPAAGGMTRTGYAFEGWMLDGERKAVGDEIAIAGETMTLVADWTLLITQQPTYANAYAVGVGTTDTIGYQWYKRSPTPISEVSGADISATQGSYDEETNTFTPDEYWGSCCIHFGTGRSTGDVFTFKSTYGDYSQTGLTIVGQAGDYTLYQYVLLESEKDWWDEWELNLSGSTAPILDAALVGVSTLDEEKGAQLTTGENGTEYFCRLTYEGGEKTIDTNRAIWYETHDPVTVTVETGSHVDQVSVYTNGVKLVKEGDHYLVTYSEVVVAVFEAESGYVFTDGTTVFTNAVTALENPTTIAGENAYLPHVHCLCGDGACAVSGHVHQDLTWKPWTATNALPTASGNWYLTEDVTLTKQAMLDAVDIRLCLNGHTVRQGAGSEERQAIVRTDAANCRFALTDCADAATPGLLTEGANGAVIVGAGVFDLWRGSLAVNTNGNDGGAVLVARGNDGVFRMYGGTICGNTAFGSGGGVYVDAETHAEFYGGAITNNVAASAGGGVFCLSWFGSYASDVVIGGALVVTDNRADEKTDNLHCLRGEIAFSADVPLTAAARVGISYTGGDTTPVVTQVFAKAYGTDCTAHLFSDDPFAYVAYNEEQKHELRTRVLVQPTAANAYTFELYTNGLAAGAVTYRWNTNAVGTAALADDDYYVYLGTQEGDVCTAYEGVENYSLNVEFYKGEVIFEFVGDIPDDLVWDYCTTNAIDATHVRVTFDSEDYGNSILTATSSFSVRFLTETQVPVPLEGETAAGLAVREPGTYFCRATIDGQTRDSDEVTVGSFDPAASVTGNGVTTYYATLEEAWTNAVSSEYDMTNVLVRMLKDATVTETLRRGVIGFIGLTFTLDLNDHVLAYAGESVACVVEQTGGMALQIVDTSTTRTPRYFTRDEETGVWTLTNEVTALSVAGGLITGGRAGAVKISYGPQTNVIRNVNLVGNRNEWNDGGAVSVVSGTLEINNATFLGNVSAGNGGAISSGVPCLMTDCRVEANVADGLGGGVHLKRCGSLVRTEVVGNRAETGGGVYLTFQTSSCFPAGTQILMADGTEKTIESVAEGDVVRTFDHVGGTNSSAAVFYVYRGEGARDVFALSFASGATLEIVDRHDLLLETTRKYVTVSSDNARSYLGKRFYNYMTGGWDELTDVTQAKDCDAHYSIYTRGHGNCVANGMLTVPDDKDCFVNIYELDDNLKADAERLAADIATYGLAEPADYPNIPLDDFVDGNIRYAFVAIGKGLTTQEEILFWNEYDYGPVVAKKAASAPRLLKGAPKLATATPIPPPSEPYLRVGEGVVVTGNISAVETTDNVYLKPSVSLFGTEYNPVIDIPPDATGIDIGVTLFSGAGIFGWTNTVNHTASFFADDPAYSVSYTADGVLALRAGIQVGGDAWATVGADGTCTIIGTGAMWNHGEWTTGNPLAAQRMAIRSVVVEDGVTSVGSQFFHKFYAITNVSCAASVTAVGDHAFYRCASLQAMSFAGADAPAFGTNAYTMHAGISIKDGMPDVYAIPAITISGYTQNLYGRVSLTEGDWEKVTTEAQKRTCRFFKIVLEK